MNSKILYTEKNEKQGVTSGVKVKKDVLQLKKGLK